MSYRSNYRDRPYDRNGQYSNYYSGSSYNGSRTDDWHGGSRSGPQRNPFRSSASYSSQSTSRYREADEDEHRSRRTDPQGSDHSTTKIAREDRNGIKGKDLGYAFIGSEKEKYVKAQLRSQIGGSSRNGDQSDISAETSSSLKLTPRHIVEECKRSGHFDAIRKQVLRDFQESALKGPFTEKLEAYLMKRIESLSSAPKQNLAKQEQRVQHLELSRWIEEGHGAAEAFDELFLQIRGKSGKEGEVGLFEQKDGRLDKDIRGRLQDVIAAERKNLQNSVHEGESDEEEGVGSDGTPMFKSSATPLGRETPKEARSSGSLGDRTPLPPA